MDKSGIIVGGVVGATIVAIMFTVLFIAPPESIKSEIIGSEHSSNIGEMTPYTQESMKSEIIANKYSTNLIGEMTLHTPELSLIGIFEKSEEGVVRVNVQRMDPVDAGSGVGSGFVFDKKGHIITNQHVVDDAKKIIITFLDGRSYNAEVVGADKYTDIAVIKVNADLTLLKPISLGDSSNLKVGEQIAAIGNPFGLSGSMTSGIVSQLGRLLPSGEGYSIPDIIQTDAAINPGNSGGPLLNMKGEIVGINTAIQSATGEFTGVGFAVPSQTIAKIVPTLIEDGKYKHPWIGISGRDIDPDTANVLELKDAVGFLIVSVVEDSPASKAGLIGSDKTIEAEGVTYPVGGDIILSVDGMEVRKIDDILIHLQRSKSVGDEMILEILRDGRTTNITVLLQERPNGD